MYHNSLLYIERQHIHTSKQIQFSSHLSFLVEWLFEIRIQQQQQQNNENIFELGCFVKYADLKGLFHNSLCSCSPQKFLYYSSMCCVYLYNMNTWCIFSYLLVWLKFVLCFSYCCNIIQFFLLFSILILLLFDVHTFTIYFINESFIEWNHTNTFDNVKYILWGLLWKLRSNFFFFFRFKTSFWINFT